jgi:uncharacterized membrane protein
MSFVGILFIAVSLPLIFEKVKPNRWYGFRTKKTLSDERIWYEANRVAGYDLLLAGIAIVAGSILITTIAKFIPILPAEMLKLALVIAATASAVIHSIWALNQME